MFEVLLSETQPKLYNHLQQVGYPLGIITTKWFMCLYAEASIPTETLLRVWDSFFLLGVDQVFFFFFFFFFSPIFIPFFVQLIYAGLTIFRIFEKEMLKCQDPEDVRNILREQPSSLFDADKFTKVSSLSLSPSLSLSLPSFFLILLHRHPNKSNHRSKWPPSRNFDLKFSAKFLLISTLSLFLENLIKEGGGGRKGGERGGRLANYLCCGKDSKK